MAVGATGVLVFVAVGTKGVLVAVFGTPLKGNLFEQYFDMAFLKYPPSLSMELDVALPCAYMPPPCPSEAGFVIPSFGQSLMCVISFGFALLSYPPSPKSTAIIP